MSQSRKMSATESVVNVIIGYFIALLAQNIIFPLFDIHVSASQHAMIGFLFTIVSLVRSYVLRRLFNSIKAK